MRAVYKGTALRTYQKYQDAQADLINKIGGYCSYCEMPIRNSPEVEHVHPVANGGEELEWDNFLLACKQCNIWKSNKNPDRSGYLWPDVDNTILAFHYQNRLGGIEPVSTLPASITPMAADTIDLMQLNRHPASTPAATLKDRRWQYRQEAWGKAIRARQIWNRNPERAKATLIGDLAHSTGFYAIWLTVFDGIDEVLTEIKARFPGTYEPTYDPTGQPLKRAGGTY